MKRLELIQFMEECEMKGVVFFPLALLRHRFANEDDEAFKKSLGRHVSDKLIDRPARGLYASPRAGLGSTCAWSQFIQTLRPLDAFYLSLETRLAEVGAISQQPQLVTLVTSGPAGSHDTPYGRIELVHSTSIPTMASGDVAPDEARGVFVASPRRAYEDMLRLNRSTVDLVDLEDLDDAQAEFEKDHAQEGADDRPAQACG